MNYVNLKKERGFEKVQRSMNEDDARNQKHSGLGYQIPYQEIFGLYFEGVVVPYDI